MRPRWWVLIGLLLLGAAQLVPRRFRLSTSLATSPELNTDLQIDLPHSITMAEEKAPQIVLRAAEAVDAARPARFWLWLGYPLAILVAETTVVRSVEAGAAIHLVLLLTLLIHASFEASTERSLLLALSLVPIARMVSLAAATAVLPIDHIWYPLTAAPLLLAALAIAKLAGLSRSDLGLRVGALPVQAVIGLLGIPIGVIEYAILRPAPLVSGPAWQELWLPAIVLIVCIGFVEEFIFRGVLQTSACASLGRRGLIYTTILFATLRLGNGSAPDALLMFFVGLLFAWLVWDTRSILGVSLAHGLTDVMIYLILPFVSFQLSFSDAPKTPVPTPTQAGEAALQPLAALPTRQPLEEPTPLPQPTEAQPTTVSTLAPSPTPSLILTPSASPPEARSTPIESAISAATPMPSPSPSATATPAATEQAAVLGVPPQAAPPVPTKAGGFSFATEQYVVKPGDTLFSIAVKFGATLELLKSLNHREENTLVMPGQTLLVPVGFPRRWESYTVQPGDTLASIALQRGATEEALAYVNNLQVAAQLQPGQQILTPPARR